MSMKKKAVSSPHVKEPRPQTWSNCVVRGDQVFISGMTAHDLAGNVMGDGSMYDQTARTFEKVKHMIEAAGGQMDDIVKLLIFVTDITQRDDVWRARAECFTGDFPSCSLVEVSALATPEILVEIEAVAYLGCAPD
jgi:enamine deaminase RidA (YjgF/YER057c/UK114 family)